MPPAMTSPMPPRSWPDACSRRTVGLVAGALTVVAVLASGSGSALGAAPRLSPGLAAPVDDRGAQPAGTNRLISVEPGGTVPDDGDSVRSAVSADGRYVAFVSTSGGLVPGLSCDGAHVYVRDRLAGTTVLVDAAMTGECPNRSADATEPSISADGRYIAFASNASDLTPISSPGVLDVFVRDTVAATTTIVSLSANGRKANGGSSAPDISADGTTVVFQSLATDLLPSDPAQMEPMFQHVYRHDVATSERVLVSRTPTGALPDASSSSPTVSGDGNRVAYFTAATDIVPVEGDFLYNVLLYDVTTGVTTLVSTTWDGEPPDGGSFVPSISADGSTIAYRSDADNIVPGDANDREDIFRYLVDLGETTMVTRARDGGPTNGISRYPDINADGTRIAFNSYASNLVARDRNDESDVFVYDALTGVTTLASTTKRGKSADGDSSGFWRPAISGDGSLVAYASNATNLVRGVPEQRPRYQVYAYRVS